MYRSEVSQRCCIYAPSLRLATRDAATDILQPVVPGERTALGPRSPAPQPAPPCFVDCIVDLSRQIRELRSMDCKTVRSLLVPHLDGELAPAQMEWIRTHLEGCAVCSDAAWPRKHAPHRPPSAPDARRHVGRNLAVDGRPPCYRACPYRRTAARPRHQHPFTAAPTPGCPGPSRCTQPSSDSQWRSVSGATMRQRQPRPGYHDLRLKLERAERLRGTRQMPSAIGNFWVAAYVPGRGHL